MRACLRPPRVAPKVDEMRSAEDDRATTKALQAVQKSHDEVVQARRRSGARRTASV